MARSGAINKPITLTARFYKNGSLFDPYSITSVTIYDAATGGTALATLTPSKISTGIYSVSWNPWDTDDTLTTGTYYDQWVWTHSSGAASKTQRYSFDLTAESDYTPSGSIVPTASGGFYVDGVFDDDSSRVLQGANAYWVDSSTGSAVELDSITLTVKDSQLVQQYLITTTTTPGITLESPANLYVVDDIDVSAFPDGDITLVWAGELDGYTYSLTQKVKYNTPPDMIFVEAETSSVSDLDITLGQLKKFTLKLRDSLNNVVDGNDVRMRIIDTQNNSTVFNLSATNTPGTGLWTVTRTFASGELDTQLNRYQIYWQFQLTESSAWLEVPNSRHWINVYEAANDVAAVPLTYSTNQDIRTIFPGIDELLEHINDNQAEREIILNKKRQQVLHTVIEPAVKASPLRVKKEALSILEAYEVYRLCLIAAHSFARFAVQDGQLAELEKSIGRLKQSLFGTVTTLRIGPANLR